MAPEARAVFGEIQFERQLGLIEVAERLVVAIAEPLRELTREVDASTSGAA